MSQDIIEAKNFPSFFRQKTISVINKTLRSGDCIQLVGLPGAGVSALGMQLTISKLITNRRIEYINLNLITEKNQESLINKIDLAINSTHSAITLFLDPFERIMEMGAADLTTILLGLRRDNFNKLSYIFTFRKEFGQNYSDRVNKDIAQLVLENTINLPPLTPEEAEWFACQVASQYDKTLTDGELKEIFILSGGHMQTVKRLVQALAKEDNLEIISNNPESNKQLSSHLERIAECTQEKTIPLMEQYLRNKSDDQRPGKESKVLDYLQKNRGRICSRDELMSAVWGEEKAYEISGHALDQLLYRLKTKTELKSKIVTFRGKGVKLDY